MFTNQKQLYKKLLNKDQILLKKKGFIYNFQFIFGFHGLKGKESELIFIHLFVLKWKTLIWKHFE